MNCNECRLESYVASQPRGKMSKNRTFYIQSYWSLYFRKYEKLFFFSYFNFDAAAFSRLYCYAIEIQLSEVKNLFLLNRLHGERWRTLRGGDSHRGKRLFAIASSIHNQNQMIFIVIAVLLLCFSSRRCREVRSSIIGATCNRADALFRKFHNSHYKVVADHYCTIDRLAIY